MKGSMYIYQGSLSISVAIMGVGFVVLTSNQDIRYADEVSYETRRKVNHLIETGMSYYSDYSDSVVTNRECITISRQQLNTTL